MQGDKGCEGNKGYKGTRVQVTGCTGSKAQGCEGARTQGV